MVRRSSGGGAIVHDRELTYCLTVPLAHPLAANTSRLYALVHDALVGALAQWQIAAHLAASGEDRPRASHAPSAGDGADRPAIG